MTNCHTDGLATDHHKTLFYINDLFEAWITLRVISFLWGYIKHQMLIPLLSIDVDELRIRISEAFQSGDTRHAEKCVR
ncbi:hypothetical protein TNCT_21451 [Trichonephila clavata]|uniref:Uncharacterized protein n=1 Tax=Trichonephila clavata TaxID=2740835 RepID=A0A8X6L4N3_TRICU|nr:hypothetical protein TNCT_21451 [Trichonephila clavata]